MLVQTSIWIRRLIDVRLLSDISVNAKSRPSAVPGLQTHQASVSSMKSLHVTGSRRVFGNFLGQLENPQGFEP